MFEQYEALVQHWLHLPSPEDPDELRSLARKALWLERRYHPKPKSKDGKS